MSRGVPTLPGADAGAVTSRDPRLPARKVPQSALAEFAFTHTVHDGGANMFSHHPEYPPADAVDLSQRWRRALVLAAASGGAAIFLLSLRPGEAGDPRYLAMLLLAVPVIASAALLMPSLSLLLGVEKGGDGAIESLRARAFRLSYHLLLTAAAIGAALQVLGSRWSEHVSVFPGGGASLPSLAVVLAFSIPIGVTAWIAPDGVSGRPAGPGAYLAASVSRARRRPHGAALLMLLGLGTTATLAGAVAHGAGALGATGPAALAVGGVALVLIATLGGALAGSDRQRKG